MSNMWQISAIVQAALLGIKAVFAEREIPGFGNFNAISAENISKFQVNNKVID